MPRPSLPPSRSGPFLLCWLLMAALVSAGCQAFPSAKADEQTSASTTTATPAGAVPLATSCDQSPLSRHDGFQDAPRCVAVDDGEVPALTPAVLIARFPRLVRAGRQFQVTISTRNLLRDRFLAAAAGGYYKEMSVLDPGSGVVRGHLHAYVQALAGGVVPDAEAAPLEFFVAIEDGGGGAGVSSVTVSVNGLTAGRKRLCVTAGDGSHRVPMMRAAKLAAAIDCVRIRVIR